MLSYVKQERIHNYQWFEIYWQYKFCAQLSWAWKFFYNLGPGYSAYLEYWYNRSKKSLESVMVTGLCPCFSRSGVTVLKNNMVTR